MCSQLAPARQKSVFRRGTSSSRSVLGPSSTSQTTCKASIRLLSRPSLFSSEANEYYTGLDSRQHQRIKIPWKFVKNFREEPTNYSGRCKYWSQRPKKALSAGSTSVSCCKTAATWGPSDLAIAASKNNKRERRASTSSTVLAYSNRAA